MTDPQQSPRTLPPVKTIFLLLLSLLLLPILHADEPRTWTNAGGKQMKGTLEAISKDKAKVLIKKDGKPFPIKVEQLSEADQDYIKEHAEPFTAPKTETFTVKVAPGKNVTVSFSDTNSKVVIVMAPGANQDELLASGLVEYAPFAAQETGFSCAVFHTDFGPLIDHGSMKNNPYFHEILTEIKTRYRDRTFVLFGGSNGGMTAMQAVEDNRSKSQIVAVIASPTSYVAKKNLKDLPVWFRMGAEDELGWAKQYEPIKKMMERGGAKLDAKLLPGEGHMPEVDFEEITSWLEGHKIVPGNSYLR